MAYIIFRLKFEISLNCSHGKRYRDTVRTQIIPLSSATRMPSSARMNGHAIDDKLQGYRRLIGVQCYYRLAQFSEQRHPSPLGRDGHAACPHHFNTLIRMNNVGLVAAWSAQIHMHCPTRFTKDWANKTSFSQSFAHFPDRERLD